MVISGDSLDFREIQNERNFIWLNYLANKQTKQN